MIDNNETLTIMNSTLTSEKILENVDSIEGWTPSICRMSGTLEWTHSESDTVIYATPNWDTDGMTPIAMLFDDSEYEHVSQFETPDIDTYVKVITMVLNSVK